MVLTDHTDSANGSATAFGRPSIVLHAAPPDDLSILGDFDDWLFILVAHEYAHVLHLGTTGGATDWLTSLFGNLFNTNAIQPRMLVEGLATYHESLFSTAGRMRSSLADMYLRADFLEGRVLSLGQLTGGPLRWPRGTAWYLYGGNFLAYVAETRGDESLRAYSQSYGSSVLPYLLDPHWKKSTESSLGALWEEWVAYARLRYEGQAKAVELRGEVTEPAWSSSFGARTGQPRFSRDGRTLYYLEASEDRRPHLRARDLGTGEDRARAELASAGSIAPLPDGRILVARPELHRTYRLRGDLFLVEGGRERQLTQGLRAWEADVAPDGSFAVFIRRGRGRAQLMRLDLEGEAPPTFLYEAPGKRQIFTPRISPDGRRVVFSQSRSGAGRDLYLLKLEGEKAPRRLTDDQSLDLQPTWFPDGKRILFASDRTGIFNLYEIADDGSRLFRRTNVLTGAFQPDVSPDGRWVAWSSYSSRGFDVALAPLDDLPRASVGVTVLDRGEAPTRVDGPIYPVRDYQAARHAFPPIAFVPYFTSGTDPSAGITLLGGDPVGIHDWQLSLGLGFESRRPEGSLVYAYRNWELRPSLALASAEQRAGVAPDLFRRASTASLSLGYPLQTLRTTQSFTVGYQATLFHEAREPAGGIAPTQSLATEVRAAWGIASFDRPMESVSPEAGASFSLTGRLGSPALGGDYDYRILTSQAGAYLRMPYARHHVLALLANAGTSGGTIGGRGAFALGGPPLTTSPIDLILRAGVLGENLLRGYAPLSFAGSEFLLASAEYRFPLVWLDAAPGWLPLYLGKLSGTVFTDAGNAFESWPPETLHPSAGAELRLGYHIGWGAIEGALRIGSAYGFHRALGGGFHHYFGLGASF